MKENMKVSIKGIKCDNPKCDFTDMSVTYEDYPNWLNKPCPKCGCNLLTEKDYIICKKMFKIASFFNKLPFVVGKTEHYQVEMNGTGKIKVTEIEK